MVDESSHVEAGVGQRDSEFSFVLKMFRLRKVDKFLDSFEKFCFGNLSCPIVFAENLEWSITIVWQIIPTVGLSISCRHSECCRKIVGIAEGIYSIVSSCAGVSSRDILAKSSAILVEKLLFERLGRDFCLGLFVVYLSDEIEAKLLKIIL